MAWTSDDPTRSPSSQILPPSSSLDPTLLSSLFSSPIHPHLRTPTLSRLRVIRFPLWRYTGSLITLTHLSVRVTPYASTRVDLPPALRRTLHSEVQSRLTDALVNSLGALAGSASFSGPPHALLDLEPGPPRQHHIQPLRAAPHVSLLSTPSLASGPVGRMELLHNHRGSLTLQRSRAPSNPSVHDVHWRRSVERVLRQRRDHFRLGSGGDADHTRDQR